MHACCCARRTTGRGWPTVSGPAAPGSSVVDWTGWSAVSGYTSERPPGRKSGRRAGGRPSSRRVGFPIAAVPAAGSLALGPARPPPPARIPRRAWLSAGPGRPGSIGGLHFTCLLLLYCPGYAALRYALFSCLADLGGPSFGSACTRDVPRTRFPGEFCGMYRRTLCLIGCRFTAAAD